MEFILDTNAYRNLVKTISISDVVTLAENFKKKEDAIHSSSAISIVVSMELIQHLINGDPFKEECYKALCLQYLHTTRDDKNKTSIGGSFYPPMNIILAKYFFNNDSEYFPLYMSVLDLVIKLTKNSDISNCDNFQKEIIIIKEQIVFEKAGFKENVEGFLRSLNSGELDWEIIRNNKPERKAWFEKLKTGKISSLLGIGLMVRAHQVMKVTNLIDDAESKVEKFIADFKAALIMNSTLLEQIGHGTSALADVNDHRWNTLNDVQILLAVLIDLKGVDKKLVTEEKKIKEACVQAGIGERVLTLEEFKTLLN